MNTSRRLSISLLALAILGIVPARAHEWTMVYATTEEQVIESADGAVPPRTESRACSTTISLAADHVVVQDDREKIIRDFSHRQLRLLTLATDRYDEWSLFGTVDFFEAELQNQNAIGAAMRAGKVAAPLARFDRFEIETTLRLESLPNPRNPAKPAITQVALERGIEFRANGKTAVRCVPSSTKLPPDLRHRFVNYLASSCAIHPEIRRIIGESEFVPEEIVYTWRNGNKITTTTLRLVSAGFSDTDSSVMPANVSPAPHDDDPVMGVIAAVRDAERGGHRPTKEDAVKFADSAIANGRSLDALLALLEHGLQSGEQLSDEIRQRRAKFSADAACQAYLQAYDQSSKAACERSLAANAKIDRTGLQRGYMLELQRANHLERLGQIAEAKAGYLTVIRANPFHAGALHDLGLLLARSYQHPQAWLCWDTARRLYPDHPMFKEIAAREAQLLSRYPDFF